jgi:hypothetical protein
MLLDLYDNKENQDTEIHRHSNALKEFQYFAPNIAAMERNQ